jgi:hypothetical protein
MKRLTLILAMLLLAVTADARIGGGDSYSGSDSSSSSDSGSSSYDSGSSSDSYSGSSSGSSSSGSGGGEGAGVMTVIFFGIFVLGSLASGLAGNSNKVLTVSSATSRGSEARVATDMAVMHRFDANFSEIVFQDFCYSLYARVHEARGGNRLDDYAPYVSASLRDGLKRDSIGLTSVDHIVIGSFTVTGLSGVETPQVTADVDFEANYTETSSSAVRRWYVRERWTLERARDILSPAPEKARAAHCPKCGAPLQTRTDGACLHCGTVIADGTFQWFVRSIHVLEKSERPPELGGSGVERGTDRPTVYQPWFPRQYASFVKRHPGFTAEEFEQRVRHVAEELQAAWTARDWHHARPYETDALFQMHRYWIDEYLRQGLRNVVDDFTISAVEVVKVMTDAFYDAITVRLFASGRDYTVDEAGEPFGGSRDETRVWTEYWTFIRGRAGTTADAKVCANCGGALAKGQTAICEYCGGKIVTGEFPWVLSRIEQDEAYRG